MNPNESTAYSGLANEGLTPEHSYDRMLYTSESNVINSTDEVRNLVSYCLAEFEKSERSRLLMRLKISDGIDLNQIFQTFQSSGIELADYPNGKEGLHRLTIGFNKINRIVPAQNIRQIQSVVQSKMDKAVAQMPGGNFERFALDELQRIENLGYSFCNDSFSSDELYRLWHQFFGWPREQCDQYASNPQTTNEQIYGLRNSDDTLVAGMLYSHTESTEWATLPEQQGQGLIVPLLIYANTNLVQQNLPEVFAELRFDRSVTAAVKSGMRIHLEPERQSLLLNQVSIGGAPDQWNRDRPLLSDGTPGEELRSFVIGTVDPQQITQRVRDAYLENMEAVLV